MFRLNRKKEHIFVVIGVLLTLIGLLAISYGFWWRQQAFELVEQDGVCFLYGWCDVSPAELAFQRSAGLMLSGAAALAMGVIILIVTGLSVKRKEQRSS
jgi:hypothetical protein